jgi:tetratricopeptide (TPR) repeat protein
MSPEQGSGTGKLGPGSDVYSLGCVLFEMLVGEPPFTGKTAQLTIAKHLGQKPPPMTLARPSLPASLVQAVETALEKRPSDRYTTAADFAAAITLPGRSTSRIRWKAKPVWTAVAGSATVVLVLGVGARWWTTRRPLLEERAVILVADFHGPESDPTLATGFRELVTTELDRSKYLRTLPRRDLNAAMRLAEVPETTFVDVSLARQLAYRSAVRAVLAGSVEDLDGENYSSVLHLVDAADGSNLLSEATTGSSLVEAAEELARRVRIRAGERRDAVDANLPLYQAMTPSFQAYLKYVEALELTHTSDSPAGIARLREAIAIDPEFAAAWAALGMKFLDARQFDSARAAFSRALAQSDRLTDAQRYRVRADIAWTIDQNLEDALRWYDLYIDEVPNSIGGRNNRAILLSSLGRYDQAARDLEEAIALNPFGPEHIQATVLNLVAAYAVLGRLSDAERASTDLAGPFSLQARLLLFSASDDWGSVDNAANEVIQDPGIRSFLRPFAWMALASAQAARGQIHAAEASLTTMEAESTGSVARWCWQARLLLAVASGQDPPRPPEPTWAGQSPGDILVRGLYSGVSGDTIRAKQALEDIAHLDPRDLRAIGQGPALVRSWVAAHGGRWDDVITILSGLAGPGDHDALSLDKPTNFATRWLVAKAFEEINVPDSAVAYLEGVIAPTNLPPVHLVLRGTPLVFAHLALARILQDSGDEEEAGRHLQAVVDGLSEPDESIEVLMRDGR